ncbi:MAG TPA: hypothetical protein VK540_34530 [Polyangiaceae bacterium]|nr:hypothetical protein [Polyangiaceae bacterium]
MPQEDKFAGHPAGISTPGQDWETLTPHDTNPLPFYPKAIVVGATGGAIVCKSKNGNTSTFFSVPGQRLDIRPHVILSTGTVATPLIGLKE